MLASVQLQPQFVAVVVVVVAVVVAGDGCIAAVGVCNLSWTTLMGLIARARQFWVTRSVPMPMLLWSMMVMMMMMMTMMMMMMVHKRSL
jgi:hypothetical protein